MGLPGHPHSVDVFVDPPRTFGTVDPYLREQHVGVGCTLENLTLGCRVRGLRPTARLLPDGPAAARRPGCCPTARLLPDGPGADRVAHVDLASDAPRPSRRYDAIGRRHTNRGPYAAGGLSLLAAAWLPGVRGSAVISLVFLGSFPFAALAWTAVVPVLLLLVAVGVAIPVSRTVDRRVAGLSAGESLVLCCGQSIGVPVRVIRAPDSPAPDDQ